MKQILVVFTKNSLTGQTLNESLSATLVMATYGLPVQICLHGDAISLLQAPANRLEQPFKSIYAMMESLEFYDVLPLWIWPNSYTDLTVLNTTEIEHKVVEINAALLNQFNHVIYW